MAHHSQLLLPEQVWVTRGKSVATYHTIEKEMILKRENRMNKWVIKVAQRLPHKQFPHLAGLQLNLYQSKIQSKVMLRQ